MSAASFIGSRVRPRRQGRSGSTAVDRTLMEPAVASSGGQMLGRAVARDGRE